MGYNTALQDVTKAKQHKDYFESCSKGFFSKEGDKLFENFLQLKNNCYV